MICAFKILFSINILIHSVVYTFPTNKSIDISIYKKISECLHESDGLICLKQYAYNTLNEAVSNDKPISVTNSIELVKNQNYKEKIDLDDKIMPEDRTAKNEKLDELIIDKIDQFLSSRSVKFNLGSVFEGRKKKDKHGAMFLMMGLAMAGMMGKLFMGKIAMIAGAALMISKIALLLSAIIGLKKLVGGSGGGDHAVVYATQSEHGHSGGWQRSFEDGSDGNDLAYRGYLEEYKQKNNTLEK